MSSAPDLARITKTINATMQERGVTRIPRDLAAQLQAEGLKRCSGCETVHPVEIFSNSARERDGLNSRCKQCEAGRLSRYHALHAETERVKRSAHYSANRLSEQLRSGYHAALSKGVHAERVTSEELLASWESRGIDPLVCAFTGARLTEASRSLDHLVPLSKGGPHSALNLVPTTAKANRTKQNNHFIYSLNSEVEPPELVKIVLDPEPPSRIRRTVLVEVEQ